MRLEAPDRLVVKAGVKITGRLAVTRGGTLVLRLDGPAKDGAPIVLLRGGEDIPIALTSVLVTDAGDLQLTGDLVVDLLG